MIKPETASCIELQNISKSFDGKLVLNSITLQIPFNSYFCICGPTGSGKSTLLRIIAGLENPDSGEIIINQQLVNNIPAEDRGIGMLFEHQTYALFPHYSIYENVIYGPRVRGESSDETKKIAAEMLELVLLADRAHDLPGVMSGGMKQRVALARALMTGSNIILLDEPLGALDAKIRLNLRKELVNMVKSLGDLTIIHVTQDIEEALMVSDYIAVLFFGNILQMGPPEDLYNNPNSIEVCNFLSKANFFEGTVIEQFTEQTGEFSIIQIPTGKIRVHKPHQSIGSKIVLAIRASDIRLQKQNTTDSNQLIGRILRQQFIHGMIRYEVELSNNQVIVTTQPYDPEHTLEENTEVRIIFSPECPLIFPYPEKPLEEIIRD